MADADFTLTEGIDPTGVFPSAYATVLLQLVREAVPNPYRGMLIYSAATPAVTGAYAWHKRCIWIKTDDWTFYFYDDDAGSWESLFSTLPADSVTTAMLRDGAVTLAKLAVGAGTAGQIIRVNAGATALEFVNVTDAIAAGTLAPAKLVPSGTNGHILWTTGGVATWASLTTILGTVAAGTFPVTVLASPGASSLGKFLVANSAGVLGWVTFDLNLVQPSGSVNPDMLVPGTAGQFLVTKSGSTQWGTAGDLPDNSIPLAKLVGGSSGYTLRMVGSTPQWAASSEISAYVVFDGTIGTSTLAIVSANTTTDEITFSGPHALTDGQVCWLQSGASGLTGLTPVNTVTPVAGTYYFKSTGATSGTLHSTKAGALDGSGRVDITATGTGNLEFWDSDPLKKSFNVDGVIRLGLGIYYVDFTSALADANYAATFSTARSVEGRVYTKLTETAGMYVEFWREVGSSNHDNERISAVVIG